MAKRQPCIYKITNLVNKKVYIGKTTVNFKDRIGAHLCSLRRGDHKNEHLLRSYRKYGESNFKFEILEECSIENIDELERMWISRHNSMDEMYGYNKESGGDGGKIMSKETRLKMSKRMKVWVKETGHIEKITRSGADNNMSRKIILVNTGEIFVSIREAQKKYSIVTVGAIRMCCAGLCTYAGELDNGEVLRWEYLENYDPLKKYDFKKPNRSGENNHLSKPVICINTGEIFGSAKEACRKYNLSAAPLCRALKGYVNYSGLSKTGEPLQWAYWVEGQTYQLKEDVKKQGYFKVELVNTGEVFSSVGEAAKKYGLLTSQISNVCKGRSISAGKLNGEKMYWRYVD